jgi:hypothetical protein
MNEGMNVVRDIRHVELIEYQRAKVRLLAEVRYA